MMHYTVMIIK